MRKNRKLLFRISIVLVPVFLIMALGISWIIYTTAVNGFLEAQNAAMKKMLELSYELDYITAIAEPEEKKWFFEHFETDPEYYKQKRTEEETEEYLNFVEENPGFSLDMLKNQSKNVQDCYIKSTYDLLKMNMEQKIKSTAYERMFMMDVTEPHRGLIFYERSLDGTEKQLGERYDISLEKHPAIKKLLESGSDEVFFERSYDLPCEGSHYMGYKPIIVSGETMAVIGIVYNWNNFRESLIFSNHKIWIFGICGIILSMTVILTVLYRLAIRPVSKLRNAIICYTDDKDTAKIVKNMYDIKAKNELGYLADSISDMALEIDHYTKENIRIAGERERAEKELYEAKVRVMVSQIQPHFMYNALSSIAMMCTIDPETAQEAIVQFSDYIRGNMDSLKKTAPVPFVTELEHLKKYLYIEKLRFGKKLNIVYDIQADGFELPQLSIQPLVENAVKHGVGMKKKGGTVTISSKETETAFEVIISDDGVGFDPSAPKKDDGRSHVGMENTRKRLHDMCGAEIVITSTVGEGTTARVILPKEVRKNEDTVL